MIDAEAGDVNNSESIKAQALIDALDDGVTVSDCDGTIHQVNRAFEQMVGCTREGLPYAPPYPWRPSFIGEDSPLESLQELTRIWDDTINDPSGRSTISMRHTDGHRIFVNLAVSLAGDHDCRSVIATLRDVTADVVEVGRESALGNLAIELAKAESITESAQIGLIRVMEFFDCDLGGLSYGELSLSMAIPEVRSERILSGLGEIERLRRFRLGPVASTDEARRRVDEMGAPLFGDAGALWVGWDEARPLSKEDTALFRSLCAQIGQAVQRSALDLERKEFAASIQQSILASTPVPSHAAVRYVPALQPFGVGGDWYDIVNLGDGRTGLVVGDSVGRGVDAASTMIKLRSATRALLIRPLPPAEVLSGVDKFARTVRRALCSTAICMVVAPDGTLNYSSAGHLPGLVVSRDGIHRWLDGAQSAPLAVKGPRRQQTISLDHGDRIVLFTDGLVERRGEVIDEGLGRLAQTATASVGLALEEFIDVLLASVSGGTEITDDTALLVFEYRAIPSLWLQMEPDLAEISAVRFRAGAWLSNAGADHETREDILLSLSEALDNAVEHSGAKLPVRVELHTDGSTVTFKVRDSGQWQDPGVHSSGRNRGRGLGIMRTVTDSTLIESDDLGTSVTMTRKVAR